MKTISLKINDDIFEQTENIIKVNKKPRNRYINEALDFYNQLQKRAYLKEKFQKESMMVREDSMKILKEFENVDHDY